MVFLTNLVSREAAEAETQKNEAVIAIAIVAIADTIVILVAMD